MTVRLGVGLVGCGAAAQAIHIPTLAGLPELFRVVHCMDASRRVAEQVAGRIGARSTRSLDELLDDREVDVVCIASPDHLHARQLAAAARAGKRGVLVEKPFAMTSAEARKGAEVAREHGTAVVVDTMHLYDPAWTAATQRWGDLPSRAPHARARAVIGPNDTWVHAQTQPVAGRDASNDPDPVFTRIAAVAAILGSADHPARLRALHGLLLGLASHDLPLIRTTFGAIERVEHAALIGFRGYDVTLRAGDAVVHLEALAVDTPRVEWSFELTAPDAQARVDFPPSFLSSVASRATVHDADGTWSPAPCTRRATGTRGSTCTAPSPRARRRGRAPTTPSPTSS